MSRKEEVYKPALIGKNIPILTLDNKWHKLFTQMGTSPKIDKTEKQLNELIKQQGKLTNEFKDIRKLKTKLMNDIVALMGEDGNAADKDALKKQEENKRLIEECNQKLDEKQERLMDLEKEIHEVNYELMLCSMDVCYDVIRENTAEIDVIDQWITKMRIELKKNVVRKQQKELYNQELYSYMHDIFGPDVIEIFDMKYNPTDKMLKKNSSEQK